MKATYWQRGESLDYKNTTNDIIPENTVIAIGTRIGVTGTVINPGEVGSLDVCDVFEMPKTTASEVITLGATVYFDGTGITTTEESNTPAGYAIAESGADAATVLVKLLG